MADWALCLALARTTAAGSSGGMNAPSGGDGGHSPRGSARGAEYDGAATLAAGLDAGTTSKTRRRGRAFRGEEPSAGFTGTGTDLGALGSRGFLSLKIAARTSRGSR